MAVEAKEVDILTKTSSDLLVEGDSIEVATFLGATSVDVVDFQCPIVVEATSGAPSSEVGDGLLSCRSLTTAATFPTEFTSSVAVGFTPSIDASLPLLVLARSTDAPGTGVFGMATDARFQLCHIDNVSGRTVGEDAR